jgi:hypothetical protein
MSNNMNKALADALTYGTGVLHKSDYVAYGDVYLGPRDSMSQHCPNCEAQAGEIERLREALLNCPIIARYETAEKFRERQDDWLATTYREALAGKAEQ